MPGPGSKYSPVDTGEDSVLSNLSSNQSGPQLNVGDFSNMPLSDLTPDQQDEFNQISALERNPATGPLALTDYYPDVNNPVAVGSYSGSEIGSTTLFAPGGGLVPLGMMDARESAIQKAAFQKARELDAFRKNYQSPTTKLVNIQPDLTKGYNEFLNRRMDEAKRKYGRQWTRGLEQDPAFLSENQSWQDLANYGDSIVAQKAKLDEMRKTGKYTVTPNLMLTEKKLLSATDPKSPDFKKLGDYYRAFQLDLDFNDVFNETVKELQTQEDAKAGIDVSNPDYIATRENIREYYNPETIEAAVQSMKAQYPGSDYFTPEYIEKNVRARMSAVKEKKNVSVQQKREGYGDTDYSQEVPETEKAFNYESGTGQFGTDGSENLETLSTHSDFGYNTKAKDQTKKLTFALGPDVKDLSGNNLGEQSGNVQGEVQYVGVMPYNVSKKRFYTTDEVKELKKKNLYENNHNVRFEAGAIVNTIANKDEKEAGNKNPVTVVVPLTDVRGKLSKGFDDKIKEVEDKAASMKKAANKKAEPAKATDKKESLRKKYNY